MLDLGTDLHESCILHSKQSAPKQNGPYGIQDERWKPADGNTNVEVHVVGIGKGSAQHG